MAFVLIESFLFKSFTFYIHSFHTSLSSNTLTYSLNPIPLSFLELFAGSSVQQTALFRAFFEHITSTLRYLSTLYCSFRLGSGSPPSFLRHHTRSLASHPRVVGGPKPQHRHHIYRFTPTATCKSDIDSSSHSRSSLTRQLEAVGNSILHGIYPTLIPSFIPRDGSPFWHQFLLFFDHLIRNQPFSTNKSAHFYQIRPRSLSYRQLDLAPRRGLSSCRFSTNSLKHRIQLSRRT